MPRDWEAVFKTWTKPSSDTEGEKQANAERMICDAIRESARLKERDIKIIPQGSYRNNTNVRQESDVDICVCCMEPFFASYEFADYGMTEANNYSHPYRYGEFKNDVELALVNKFGRGGVRRGDKAFDIHANTYRVDADVVAAFAHRRYQQRSYNPFLIGTYTTPYTKPEGTEFYSDSGRQVINWPEQHYTNGVAKNKRTGYRFKEVVRALKNLKYEMESCGNPAQKKAGKEAPSYLIECLVYNVPDPTFTGDSPRWISRNVIVHCYDSTKTDGACNHWIEVNEMKYLFHLTQPWTQTQANTFLLQAWQYGEFS